MATGQSSDSFGGGQEDRTSRFPISPRPDSRLASVRLLCSSHHPRLRSPRRSRRSRPRNGDSVSPRLNVHFGTLNIANRFRPKLNVWSNVAAKIRLRPFVAAKRHPFPAVIRSPLRAGTPLITMSFGTVGPLFCYADALMRGALKHTSPGGCRATVRVTCRAF
jgi:hypothetical protein